VTDANLVLGIIDPDYFLGGRMKLDKAKAEAAVGSIAAELRVSLPNAAWVIYTTINHSMIAAIEDVTINEGIDPRESYMISGGGATACHISHMARIVGIRRFMVPKLAAGLSAYGGLLSDIRWEETATLHTTSRSFDAGGVDKLLVELTRRGDAFLYRAGVAPDARSFSCAFQGRYLYQSWDIEVTFERGVGGLTPEDLSRLADAFHAQHERIYTIKDVNEVVEFTTWKVRAIGDTGGRRRRDRVIAVQAGRPEVSRERSVYLGTHPTLLPVYDGALLGANATIAGPAIIEETTTTLLLLEGQAATTDSYGNYLVEAG
jgi:N-methylhydantoinase A